MRTTIALFLLLLTLGQAQENPPSSEKKKETAKQEFFTPKRDRKKIHNNGKFIEGRPNVLIIGDSISIGYTPTVIAELEDTANIFRIPANGGNTGKGLKQLDNWLGTQRWDVIHFNWGLWDLCYRNPKSKVQGNRDKVGGKLTTSLEQYEKNLDKLVSRLKKTKAKLIWASTTTVPKGEAGRKKDDDNKYNEAAVRVMKKHGVAINDLNNVSDLFPPELFIGPGNVHFKTAGSKKLAETVAKSILKSLGK